MEQYVYLAERQKFAWINGKWVATKDGNAWSSAIYRDFKCAKADALQDSDYMFGNFSDGISRKFLKKDEIERSKDGFIVGTISVIYTYCRCKYMVKYTIKKKNLI